MQEWQAVEDHFASVSPGDIEMALEELRNSEKREHREQAGKVLVAYLLWCWRSSTTGCCAAKAAPSAARSCQPRIDREPQVLPKPPNRTVRPRKPSPRAGARLHRNRSELDALASRWRRMLLSSPRPSVNGWRRPPQTQPMWRTNTSCPSGAGRTQLSGGKECRDNRALTLRGGPRESLRVSSTSREGGFPGKRRSPRRPIASL